MTTYGLTPTGFVVKRQSVIITEIQAQLQATFGVALNLLPQSVLGQILGIYSEREALVWELAQAVYASQYPAGAEGTSVDNILALSNLKRLKATATVTAPTDTAGVPGLLLSGTPGTVIAVNSILSVINNPQVQFLLDADVTIAAAVNAIQLLILSAPPTSGAFALAIEDASGNTLTTPSIPWSCEADTTGLAWSTLPTSGAFTLTLHSALGTFTTPSRPYNTTDSQIEIDVRALNAAYANVLVDGSISAITLGTLANTSNGSATLTAVAVVQDIVIGCVVSGPGIPANTTVLDVNGNSVLMSNAATVTASFVTILFSGCLTIKWVDVSQPTVTLTSTLAPVAGTVLNSIQSGLNTLMDSVTNTYPYTDVICTGSLDVASVAINFGAGTALLGQPVSSAQPQNAITVPTNTMQTGSTVVNTAVLTSGVGTATGAPAEGVGSATCTQTGPIVVPAGYLTVIGSPVSGWTGVNNPLDCVTGTDVETDPAALTRRNTDLASNANGPLQAIEEKVSLVPGVVQAKGFQNLSLAALQILTFSDVPASGVFELGLNGGVSVRSTGGISFRALANVQAIYFSGAPTGGFFTITMNSLTTGHILFSATAVQVQAAVQALSGFEDAVATGSFLAGFFLSFGAGSVQQYPLSVASSLTGASVIATVPSVQSLINAVSGYEPATVVGSYAATMVVAFNGSTGGQPQQLITAPLNTLENSSSTPISITSSFGRPGKSFEIVVNDNNGEASNALIGEAIFESAPAGIQSYGNQPPVTVSDDFGNTYQEYYSRPTQIPIYVVVSLQTDLTTSQTPQFSVNSIITLQEDIAETINAFGLGGLIIGFGSAGIAGSFNTVPGIQSYTFAFGTSPNPTQNVNIQLLSEQVPLGETFNIIVTYT